MKPVGSNAGKSATTFSGDLSLKEPKYDLRAHLVMCFIWPQSPGAVERHRAYYNRRRS